MSTADIGAAAEALAHARQVVWMTGAGISVASGIAPYRKSADAVWANFITEWGTLEKFQRDPLAWYRGFWLKAHPALLEGAGQVKPNPGHDAIARFLRKYPSHRLITQNIDGLHGEAGAPRDRTIEIHGRHDVFTCTNRQCSHAGAPLWGVNVAVVTERDEPPECEWCGRPLRPLVLLFDETYDSHPIYRAREARAWLNDADVVAFVGTSFSVGITAMALQAARENDARLINLNLDAIADERVVNVIGPSEETLPQLAQAVGV